MLARCSTGLGVAVLALGACSGGAGNDRAAPSRTETSAGNRLEAAGASAAVSIDARQALAACVPPNERELTIDRLTRARRAELNRCYNAETVRQLRPRLPIRIDSRTAVDGVSAEGQALVYRYRIGLTSAELRPGLAARLEADTRRHACRGEDVRQTVALGGAVIYRWVDRDAALIREVRIGSCPAEGTTAP